MVRRLLVLSLVLGVYSMQVFAGNGNLPKIIKYKNEPTTSHQTLPGGPAPMIVGTSVYVDTMQNAYSTQAPFTNQIDYLAGSIVITKRGWAELPGSGSGFIHYNWSTDGGTTWGRSAAINGAQTQQGGRHPSVALSYDGVNPAVPVGMWGELVSGAFGGLVCWYDLEVGADLTTISVFDITTGTTNAGVPDAPFANGAGHVFFTLDDGALTGGETWLAKSVDAGNSWSGIADGSYWISAADVDAFIGGAGDFAPDGLHGGVAFAGAEDGGLTYKIGLKETADGGATWGAIEWIDVTTVTGTPSGADIIENASANIPAFGTGGAFEGAGLGELDIVYDANNNPHIALTLLNAGAPADMNDDQAYLVDLYHNGTSWSVNVVANATRWFYALPGGLDTRNENSLARNAAGTLIYMKWMDGTVTADANADGVGDSTDAAELYLASWTTGGAWGNVTNVTGTPTIREKYSQMAARLDGNNEAVIMWTYFGDNDVNDLSRSIVYYLKDAIVSIENPGTVARSFELKQNYPNPFNPSTTISYRLEDQSRVSLKVYNLLGQEVRTLVAGTTQEAATHNVVWDGKDNSGKSVASGVYMYRLEAGNTVQTKKMVFMK